MESKVNCTRRLTFCSGHRVMGHENKCANLHGHNYTIYLTACADSNDLDGIGRVIDFSVLKSKFNGWLENNWDHGFVLFSGDAEAIKAVTHIQTQKLYLMPTNPTAENMARHILDKIGPALLEGTGVSLTKVIIEETENCSAEATK